MAKIRTDDYVTEWERLVRAWEQAGAGPGAGAERQAAIKQQMDDLIRSAGAARAGRNIARDGLVVGRVPVGCPEADATTAVAKRRA